MKKRVYTCPTCGFEVLVGPFEKACTNPSCRQFKAHLFENCFKCKKPRWKCCC